MLVSVIAIPAWSSEPTPLWKADLRRFQYESFPRKMVRPVRVSAAFIDNHHVAIAWISPDATENNRHKVPHWGDAAHANLVVIDSNTGHKQEEKQWPVPFTHRGPVLAGVDDGNVLMCSDNALRLLSGSLNLVREEELPNGSTCDPSPSGHTLLVVNLSEHNRQLRVIDTKTFRTLASWTEPLLAQHPAGEATISISDHWLLGYCGEPTALCVRRFDENWHPLEVKGIETRMTGRQRIPASFVSDEVVAIRARTTTLATVGGAMLFQITAPPKRMLVRPPISSAGGQSFIMVEGRDRGIRSEPLDMYPFYADDSAAVYGVNDHQKEFSLMLQGTSPWTPWHFIENVMALSPDGRSLALISDGALEVFAVPPGSVERH